MENTHEKMVQEVVIIVSKLMKERGGIHYCYIAKYIGVDSALLSRWLCKRVTIGKYYYPRVRAFLKGNGLESLKDDLVQEMIACFNIKETGHIAWFMRHISYEKLIDYLFDHLTLEHIEEENQINHYYLEMVKETIVRKNVEKKQRLHCKQVYSPLRECPVNVKEKLLSMNICAENTLIMEFVDAYGRKKRCCILFYDSDNPYRYLDAVRVQETVATCRCLGRMDYFVMLKLPETHHRPLGARNCERVVDYAARKIVGILKRENNGVTI